MIDLHMHSTKSDGMLEPSMLALALYNADISWAALADHDTVAGQDEFMRSCRALGIFCITGVELSLEYERELHMLVYGYDPKNEAFCRALDEMSEARVLRALQICELLNRAGVPIDYDEVVKHTNGIVARPHIAAEIVRLGYAKDMPDAFNKYLTPGRPTYVQRKRLTPERAIKLAHDAGGYAVLAHPGLLKGGAEESTRVAMTLRKKYGLDGIEAFYPSHSDEDVQYYCMLAHKLGMFVTKGSDFHGDDDKHSPLGQDGRINEFLAKSITKLFKQDNLT